MTCIIIKQLFGKLAQAGECLEGMPWSGTKYQSATECRLASLSRKCRLMLYVFLV